MCYIDLDFGEIGLANGQFSWDPTNYPMIGDENCLSMDDERLFWTDSRTIVEESMLENLHTTFDMPIPPPYSDGAGSSGTAANRDDNDFMVVGTISESPRQQPRTQSWPLFHSAQL